MWAFKFIRITHILQGMSPKGTFFFFPFKMVPWGVSPKSHPSESLQKTGQSQFIWQFRNPLVPITKLLCPTTRWSLKQLNVTIWLTRTHARVHTRAQRRTHAHAHTRTVTKGLSRWTCDCVLTGHEISKSRWHIQVSKNAEIVWDPIWFYDREKSHSFNRGSGISQVDSWSTQSTDVS